MLKGAYWLKQPKGVHAIAYMGALAPEAIEAWGNLAGDRADLGLLAITSPDLLHRDWSSAQARRARGETVGDCHIERMLAPLGRDGQIVGVVDGSPSCLTWLGGVHGQKVHGLGVDRFGQTGTLQDLYAEYGLDADSIQRAAQFTFTRSNRTWA
jgi:pyruvate dehydrogenase E1 component